MIDKIVEHCKGKDLKNSMLQVTGPCLLGEVVREHRGQKFIDELPFEFVGVNEDGVQMGNVMKDGDAVIKQYKEYRDEMSDTGIKHYSNSWKEKNVYNRGAEGWSEPTRKIIPGGIGEGSLKDITLAVLTWNSPKTLKNTLDSYKKHGLLDMVHSTVYFQERKPADDAMAKKYGIDEVLGTSENVGVFDAFIAMIEACKTPYFLLAECDFELVNNRQRVRSVLEDCIKLMSEDDVKVVRLRDRYRPGKPLHSRGLIPVSDAKLELYDYSDYISKAEMVHFVKNPDKKLPGVFTVADQPRYHHKWYICDYKDYHWSTNVYIAKTDFLKDVIIKILKENISNSSNRNDEYKMNGIEHILWREKDRLNGYKIASGLGLFMHKRLDHCKQHCDQA